MVLIIALIFCLYQLPNIGNKYSNILFTVFIVAVIAIWISVWLGKTFNIDLIKYKYKKFQYLWVFDFFELLVLAGMSEQFFYSNYNLITKPAMDYAHYEARYNDSDWYGFIEMNEIFIPKCIKELITVESEIYKMADMEESQRVTYYNENVDRLNSLTQDSHEGMSVLLMYCKLLLAIYIARKVYTLVVQGYLNCITLCIAKHKHKAEI